MCEFYKKKKFRVLSVSALECCEDEQKRVSPTKASNKNFFRSCGFRCVNISSDDTSTMENHYIFLA